MAAFVWPGDSPADVAERLGCLADFLADTLHELAAANVDKTPGG